MAEGSAHVKQVEREVYKLSVVSQTTSITTTAGSRYEYKIGEPSTVKAQHYILLLLWRIGALWSKEILSYMKNAGYNIRDLRDLHSRIYYLRRSKLIVRDESGKYRLTEHGEKYAKELCNLYMIYAKSSEKIRNILGTIGIFSSIEDVLKTYGRYIENKLSKILNEIREIFRLNEDETAIMEYLFEHLKFSILINKRSKSAYAYANIMQRNLGFDPAYFKELISNLQSKGLVYIYPQRNGMPARIGLKPELVQKLWSDLEASSSIYSSTYNSKTDIITEAMLLKPVVQRRQSGEAITWLE